jgi:hypothetical protein
MNHNLAFFEARMKLWPLPDGVNLNRIEELFRKPDPDLRTLFDDLDTSARSLGCVCPLGFEIDYPGGVVVLSSIWSGTMDVGLPPEKPFLWIERQAGSFERLRTLTGLVAPRRDWTLMVRRYGMVLPSVATGSR